MLVLYLVKMMSLSMNVMLTIFLSNAKTVPICLHHTVACSLKEYVCGFPTLFCGFFQKNVLRILYLWLSRYLRNCDKK